VVVRVHSTAPNFLKLHPQNVGRLNLEVGLPTLTPQESLPILGVHAAFANRAPAASFSQCEQVKAEQR
jgi:hypothetical protein